MFYFLIGAIFTTLMIGVPIVKAFLKEERRMDLLFLVFCNILFLVVTTYFLYFLKDELLALVSSFFLLGYAFFLMIELKKEKQTLLWFELPYFFFTFFVFACILFGIFF